MKTAVKMVWIVWVAVMVSAPVLRAQDTLVRHDGTREVVIIKEVNSDEVKYIKPGLGEEVLFSLRKGEVRMILFRNGEKMEFGQRADTREITMVDFRDQRKHILKTEVFSPWINVINFTYEGCYRPKRSIELSLGIIGISPGKMVSEYELADPDDQGFILKLGHKWIFPMGEYFDFTGEPSVLNGFYTRVELDFASYSTYAGDYNKGGILFSPGWQVVFWNRIAFDTWGSIGVGTGGELEWDYPYGFWSMGIAFSFGFKIGIIIG